MRYLTSVVALVLALAAGTPATAQDHSFHHEVVGDIMNVINDGDGLGISSTALIDTGLDSLLQEGNYTIFVPSDEAWSNLDDEVRERLFEADNLDQLKEVLEYHIIMDRSLSSEDLLTFASAKSPEPTVKNMYGKNLPISDGVQGVLIQEANIIEPDLESANGIVHVIDTVLLPPGMDSAAVAD